MGGVSQLMGVNCTFLNYNKMADKGTLLYTGVNKLIKQVPPSFAYGESYPCIFA